MAQSQLDLVVAGTENAVLMVESEAQAIVRRNHGGVVFGHEQGNIAINAIHELVREAGKPCGGKEGTWAPALKTKPLSPKSMP